MINLNEQLIDLLGDVTCKLIQDTNDKKIDAANGLYEAFLNKCEPILLEAVMQKCKYNQVRAAKILGISRGTLRKKLKEHFDNKYFMQSI